MRLEWRGRSLAVWVLMALLGTLGIRALIGGGQFIIAPSGDIIGVSTTVLASTPVRDFFLPGLFLFVALGIAPLLVLFGLYSKHRWAIAGTIVVAGTLVGWAIIEGVVIGPGERLQYFNLLQGIVMLILAVYRWRTTKHRAMRW